MAMTHARPPWRFPSSQLSLITHQEMTHPPTEKGAGKRDRGSGISWLIRHAHTFAPLLVGNRIGFRGAPGAGLLRHFRLAFLLLLFLLLL